MIFYLYERHSLKARVLESGKKSINWVSVINFETLIFELLRTQGSESNISLTFVWGYNYARGYISEML